VIVLYFDMEQEAENNAGDFAASVVARTRNDAYFDPAAPP